MLVIIRGLPGSGKSTLAKLLSDYHHYEADQYFVKDGVYNFDIKKIAEAHADCIAKTRARLECGKNVVVTNTFVKLWEISAYEKMAKDLGVDLKVVKATGNFKNVHDVPTEVIERMRSTWEDYPNEMVLNKEGRYNI